MKCLAYTSPARGHLYPLVDTLRALHSRGHEVHVRTLASELPVLRELGLHAEAIASKIEAQPLADYDAPTPEEGIGAVLTSFAERVPHEIGDLRSGIAEIDPDFLLVDVTTPGAAALAEAEGLPWAQWSPYLQHVTPAEEAETVVTFAPFTLMPAGMDLLNSVRASVGLAKLSNESEAWRAPLLLYFTAEPFELAGLDLPESFRSVGPGLWEPDAEAPAWLEDIDEPLVLITASSEFQRDDSLIATALEALADDDVHVVATTVAHDPARFPSTSNSTVTRWLPHAPLIRKAACVVCHGGMGITQKALAAGVPVCAVPFGRDQFEVAGCLTVAGAGTAVMPDRLEPASLGSAIREAMTMAGGADRVAQGFSRAGGAAAAADAVGALLDTEMAPVEQLTR